MRLPGHLVALPLAAWGCWASGLPGWLSTILVIAVSSVLYLAATANE